MTEKQNEVLASYVKRNNKLIGDIQLLIECISIVNDTNRNYDPDMESLFRTIIRHDRSHIRNILLEEAELILNKLKQELEKTSLLQILSEVEKIQ